MRLKLIYGTGIIGANLNRSTDVRRSQVFDQIHKRIRVLRFGRSFFNCKFFALDDPAGFTGATVRRLPVRAQPVTTWPRIVICPCPRGGNVEIYRRLHISSHGTPTVRAVKGSAEQYSCGVIETWRLGGYVPVKNPIQRRRSYDVIIREIMFPCTRLAVHLTRFWTYVRFGRGVSSVCRCRPRTFWRAPFRPSGDLFRDQRWPHRTECEHFLPIHVAGKTNGDRPVHVIITAPGETKNGFHSVANNTFSFRAARPIWKLAMVRRPFVLTPAVHCTV